MANILSLDNFTSGKYNIPDASSSIATARVTEAITLNEDRYLNRLLGVDFAIPVKAYIIAAGSGNALYNKIINPLSYQPKGCYDILESDGILVLLKACIYYAYNKSNIKLTIAGPAVTKAEVSQTLSPGEAMRSAESYFNEIIDTAECIQQYCTDNPTDYPDYDGRRFTVKASGFL